MAEKIFEEIRRSKDLGIEAMLQTAARVAEEKHEFRQAALAKYYLTRFELKIPDKFDHEPTTEQKVALNQLEEDRLRFLREAGEAYRNDKKYALAAVNFTEAGRFEEAIDAYLREGSEKSRKTAAHMSIWSGVDICFGVYYVLEREGFKAAVECLEDYRVPEKDRQSFGEDLVKLAYQQIVDSLRKQVEGKKGQIKVSTLGELVAAAGNMKLALPEAVGEEEIDKLERFIRYSKERDILTIGIDLIDFESRNLKPKFRNMLEPKIRYLRGKLEARQEDIDYFINEADKSDHAFNKKNYAVEAIEILSHHRRFEEALKVAEKYLDANDNVKFDLLRELGDNERLATAYEQANNPVSYALALAGKLDLI